MKRYLVAAGAFTLVAASVVIAQDVQQDPAQPGAKFKAALQKLQFGAQPGIGKAATRVTAAKMAVLEEEFESIEAHREVKKAYVRAAEVALRSAETNFEQVGKPGLNVPQIEVARARLEVEAAKAQVEIRMAELKEVDVRLKYAKKRLEDAKVAGVRPLPVRPVQVDPPPPPALAAPAPADDKVVAELKKKVAEAEAAVKDRQEALKKAETEAKAAAAEHARILDIAMRGRVRPGTIETAAAKAEETRAAADKAKKAVTDAENLLDKARAKLKEVEK